MERMNIQRKTKHAKKVEGPPCVERGHTPTDGHTRSCSEADCKAAGGVGHFDADSFARWRKNGRRGRLLCCGCAAVPSQSARKVQKR